jgi:hypothetical protein
MSKQAQFQFAQEVFIQPMNAMSEEQREGHSSGVERTAQRRSFFAGEYGT